MKIPKFQKLRPPKTKGVLILLFLVCIPSMNIIGTSLLMNFGSNDGLINVLSEINENGNEFGTSLSNVNRVDFNIEIITNAASHVGNEHGTISSIPSNAFLQCTQQENGSEDAIHVFQISVGITYCNDDDLTILLHGLGILGFFSALEYGVIVGKKISKSRKENEKDNGRCGSSFITIIDRESFVLDSIYEYLEKNRIFESDKIIPYLMAKCAKSETDLTELGIRKMVKSFIGRNIIMEKSKLTRETLLENPNRNAIYSYIIDNPGVHFMKLARDLNVNASLLRWHLDVLIKFNLIKEVNVGNRVIFHDVEVPQDNAKLFHFISKKRCADLINYLQEKNEWCTKSRLASALGMHSITITKYLAQLSEFRIITHKNVKNSTLYRVNEKVLHALLS